MSIEKMKNKKYLMMKVKVLKMKVMKIMKIMKTMKTKVIKLIIWKMKVKVNLLNQVIMKKKR